MRKLLLAFSLAGALTSPALAAVPNTPVGNVNYTILNTDVRLIPIAALTTNRTWTLPYAGSMGANGVIFQDAQGNIGGSNSCVVIAAQSGDTINGTSGTYTFCATYGTIVLTPVTGTNWVVSGNNSLLVTTNVPLGSAKQITTNSSITLGSVSLPPGDWDCRGTAAHQLSATTTATKLSASLVTTDGVLGTQGTDATTTVVPASAISTSGVDLKLGPARFNLASTTTVFLVDGATFATSQLWGYGSLTCRGQD